ncbi:SDR family NAD(P)-dependent oxidoreductase [Tenggerimyces flavus]|uniref:SDR family NAD(P)-dependent oxidoreductase n=1 Tax=Tenggerimyces flavus TaxID=1708749 RepID=A0ABV7YKK5_9ACTN|nr:SDR family oxidoreductase [Tenggerimyces flavus]MBM7787397.1 NAD(P)-dependent dehydrogenase (short-subunit alcohol dehydrogenase family) [Tenggerimyces flavus]
MPVAIVTGASRGLGLALAHGLAERGWSLVVDARNAGPLTDAARELKGCTNVIPLTGSVADPQHRADLLEAARSLGGLDLLVNNAGTLGPSPLPALGALNVSAYRDILEVGTVAPLALTQQALPILRENGGAVLNITSDAAVEAYEGWGGYGSAKAALEQWSHVLAEEEKAVRVWWVDPGDLRTQMHQDAFPGEDISDRPLPDTVVPAFVSLVETRPPSGRYKAAELPTGAVA